MAGYVKILEILDDIMEHPMLTDITLELVIKHSARFMQIVGVPKLFDDRTAILEVTKYKAELPCDFYSIIGVRMADTHRAFRATTDIYHMSPNKRPAAFRGIGIDVDETPECKAYLEVYNLIEDGTDANGMNVPKTMKSIKNNYSYTATVDDIGFRDLTYKIQGNYIFTSIEEGNIEISYVAIPVDEEGLPMIPDDEKYKNALELYIKKKLFTVLFDQQKLHQSILQNTQQEYAFAVGQLQNSMTMPTIDEMEAITNMWNQAIWRVSEHRNGFIDEGNKEFLRRH